MDHECIINDVFHVPNSPVNLVGVTKFGKQIEPKDEEFPEGTNMQTFTNHSVFTWDRGQFKRTLIHPPCSMPTIFMNNRFQKLEALCTVLEKVDNEMTHKAFMTDGGIPDESLKGFMEQLRDMVKGQDLSDEMTCYCCYHNVLNHTSLQDMHALARKDKLPKKLLKIKSTPPCASCLFGRAHRKPWRAKGDARTIRKEGCKPGEECSVDQIVVSSPGLVPQTSGKPAKRRHVGSQLTMDHESNYCCVAHLEDFSVAESLNAKHMHERAASACGNTVRKHRSDNGRFSDREFLEDACSSGQQIELCGVGAHHQNGKSERHIKRSN